MALLILTPVNVIAEKGVDVTLSVQEVRIQDAIRPRLSSTTEWAFVAVDLETGERLVNNSSSNGRNNALVPGSLLKLFVTAAVLERNSHDAIDLSAILAIKGNVSNGTLHGDVIIKGRGNPFISKKDLVAGIEKIKTLGLKEIAGDVIVDDTLFDVKDWKSRYKGPAYAVPAALGLDLHTVSITADPASRQVTIGPSNADVRVSFNASGKAGIRQIDDLTYEVTGAAPHAVVVHNRFPLADPAMYAGGTLMTLLKKQGIKVSGRIKRGVFSSEAREISRIGSQEVNEFVRDTNQQSLNVAADNLLFVLGAVVYGTPGTHAKGVSAVKDYLHEAGVPLSGLVIDDGSGISEKNRITPEQMITLLRTAATKPWFKTFYDSLSRPGIDGRLREFGYRAENVRIKTGQIREAYCLAGYIDRKNGRRIAFIFMINGPEANTPVATSAAIDVLRHLEE